MPVESGPLAGNTGAEAGVRGILAWESSSDDIGLALLKLSVDDVVVALDP
jgi:hypothetical protein